MTTVMRIAALVLLLGGQGPVAAQDSEGPCGAPAYRAFDFWVGEWRVVGPGGAYAGDNTIALTPDGCLLREHWRGAGGGEGRSLTWLDPGTRRWRQVWVSRGFTIDIVGGPDDDGALFLEGSIHYRDGRIAPFRGRWHREPDGTVIQAFHEGSDQGIWEEWFRGRYVPAP